MRRIVLVCAAMAFGLGAVPASAKETLATPYELVRTLQRVQDRIALGSTQAHHAQRKLLHHIADRFRSVDPVAWREPRNVRALAIFLLSGGNPKVGRRIYAGGIAEESNRKLIKATLAYAEGRKSAATKLLSAIEPMALPASLGGHVALVKSALYHKTSPKKSMAYLDMARLLMPGTLIEEASLRRGIVAAGDDGNLERFEHLAAQYLKRFSSSVYNADFDAKFAQYLVKLSFLEVAARQSRFENMVVVLKPARLRRLYLSLARNAVVAGQINHASFAASRANSLSLPMSKGLERARAYEAVAIVTKDPNAAMNRLNQVDLTKLTEPDRQIVSAALAVSQELLRVPSIDEPEVVQSPHVSSETKPMAMPADNMPDGVAGRAEKLIEVVDDILMGKMQ